MAILKLYHQGQLLKELELNSSEEYFIGRGSQCQFILEHDRGISRQHVRLVYENDTWNAILMSRFGGLVYAGQSVEHIRLDNDTRFSIPPYEFEFLLVAAAAQPDPSSIDDDIISSAHEAKELVPVNAEVVTDQSDSAPFSSEKTSGNFEATRVGVSTIVPFLRITNHANGQEEILKLEGNVWGAGRHPDSEIYINDNSISRKHFELSRTEAGFFITDQNSSNGTTINDERIPPGEPYKLMSGDVITVRNIQIVFEIHDVGFQQKISKLPAIFDQTDELDSTDPYESVDATPASQEQGPAVIKISPGKLNWQQHKTRIAIGTLVLVMFTGYFFYGDGAKNPSSQEHADGASELGSKKEISPQKMKELQDKYELAEKNYRLGNHTLCKDMLNEIHAVVPSIGDSQNLLKFCEQAIELTLINKERELKEKKRAETEARISSTVANCQSLYSETISYAEMQECLSEAMDLDPQNVAATELLERVKARDEQKKDAAVRQHEIAQLANEGRAHYKRAANLESRGELRKALNEYSSFLKKNYPSVATQEESARRSVANIQQNLNQKISERISSCRLYIEKNEYKQAIKACGEALREDPQNNDAQTLKERAETEMSRGLKSVYEDSVLEESMGNIEAAKEKWKTIMGNSYPGENFYDKAKSKLRKYGG